MKKKFILMPVTAIMLYVALTASSGGPGGDLTVGGCSCHNAGPTASTNVSLQLMTTGLSPVTNYVGGGSYIIRITGTQTNGALVLAKYGYQVGVVSTTSTSTSAGILATIPQSHVITPSISIIEHTAAQSPISGTGGAGTIYQKDIPWTAPIAGFGGVTLLGVINAVKLDGVADGNDKWNNSSTALPELTQITGPGTVCTGSNITLASTPAGGAWSSGTTAVGTVNTSGVVQGITSGTTNITYSLGGNIVVRTVTVNDNPGAFGGTPVVCMTNTTTVTNAVSGGTWISGSPGIATVVTGTGVVTGVLNGTSLLTYAIGSCSATTTVTVNAKAANTGTPSVCEGATTPLSNSNTGGTWSSSASLVGTVGTSGIVTGLLAGTTNISYILPTGCTSVTNVTVNQMPSAIGGTLQVCPSATVTATNSVSGGTWSSSAGSGSVSIVGASGVITGSTAGTANITYTMPGGCLTTAVVTINPQPSLITGTTLFCANATTTLSSTPAGGTWSSSNTGIAIAGPSTGIISGGGTSGGIAFITYTLPVTGCIRVTNVNVQAISPISGMLSVCQGGTTTLNSAPASGTWTSGATGVATVSATGGVVAGLTAGTAGVTYTVSSGCSSNAVVTVNANAVITGGGSVCIGSTLSLSNSVTGGTWSSSVPAVGTVDATSGVFAALTSGTSTVSYTTAGGCVSTTVVTVNVAPGAVTGSGGGTFCGSTTIGASGGSGGTIFYQGTTAGGTSAATPSTSQVVTVTGTYYFRVRSTAGCWGPEAAISVTINPVPSAISGIAAICVGSSANLSSTPSGGTWVSGTTATGTINATTGVFMALTNGTSTITYTSPAGCTVTDVITVNTAPGAVTGAGGGAFCASATISASGGAGGTIFYQGTVAGGTSATTASTSQVVTSTGTYYFRVRSSAGCWGPEAAISVTINPIPSTITGSNPVCANAPSAFSSTPTGGTWASGATATGTIDATTGMFTGLAAGTTNITYTAAGCTTTKAVTVLGTPATVTVSGGGTFCASAALTASGGAGGTIYYQGLTSAGTSTVTASTSQSVTASGTYYFRSRSAAGCWGPEGSVTVSINPAPAAITGPTGICEGGTGTLSCTPTGGTWNSSNTGVATIGSTSGIATAAGVGVTNIIYTITSTGCTSTRSLSVNALPSAISGTLNVCEASSTTLSSTPTGGTWTSSDAGTAIVGSSSGTVIGVDDGTALITYTLGTGCARSAIATVNPLPAAIVGGNVEICVNGSVTLTNSTGTGTWSSGTAGVATVTPTGGNVTGISAGTTIISYTLSTGCRTTTNISVNPLPSTISGSLSACLGFANTLSSTPTGGTWTSSNTTNVGIGSATGVVSGLALGTSTISYILPTGCARSATVTVNALPTTITGTASTCVGVTTTLGSTPAGGTWSSSNTSTATVGSSTGIVTGAGIGTANITYTAATTGCFTTRMATINAAPTAGTISGSTSVCTGLTISLSSTVTGGVWSSSAPGIASVDGTTGVVTGVLPGTATISYAVTTSCGTVYATQNVNVTISAVSGAITGTQQVCTGGTTTLSSTVLGGTWSSDNTSIAGIGATTGVVSGNSAGTANITYTISSSCGVATVNAQVTVNPLPSAISGASTVCVNATTTFTNAGSGTWSSANSAIASANSTTGDITGVTDGTTTITFALPTGCTTTKSITVLPQPAVIGGSLTICAGSATTLTNATSGGTWSSSSTSVASIGSTSGTVNALASGSTVINYTAPGTGCIRSATLLVNPVPASFTGSLGICPATTTDLSSATLGGTWASSNSSVATINATTGTATGVNAGTAIITYEVSTGCRRFGTLTVNALPALIGGTTSLCLGTPGSLTNSTTGGTWSSSNTGFATVGSSLGTVTGVAQGALTITYTSAAGCIRTTGFTVNPTPASITGTLSACVGSTTALASATSGGVWVSSNTTVASVNIAGTVTGNNTGTTNISYVLSTGCSTVSTVTVNAVPASISGTPTACLGSTRTLTSSPAGGTWSSSAAGIADVGSASGIVTGAATGPAFITYTLPTGCYRVTSFVVNPLPAAITGTTTVCEGGSTSLSCATTGGAWTSSATATATVGTISGLVSGIAAGTANVSYTLSTGCRSVTTVTVNPTPTAITGPGSVCVGATATLNSTPAGGAWSSGSGGTANVGTGSGIVTGIAAGVTSVSYILSTGCSNATSMIVNPLPMAGTVSGTATVCIGATSALSATVTGGFWSITTGKASVSTTGLITGIASGQDTINYTVTNVCGAAIARYAVTVNPLPVAGTISGSTDVCVGSNITLTTTGTGGAWTSGNAATATVSGTGSVHGVAVGSTTISYAVTNSCGTATTTYTIAVHPVVDAGVLSGPDSVCISSSISLTSTVTGGTWGSSNTTVAVVGPDGTVTGLAAGTATIVYGVFNVCSVDTATHVIAVKPCASEVGGVARQSIISLYPNPTNGVLTIETPVAGTLTVHTIDGREVYRREVKAAATTISLPNGMASGVYLCRFTGADGSNAVLRLVYTQ